MGLFDIDYEAKSWQFLPVRLRQAVQYAWAKVCVSGVLYLSGIFAANRKKNLYDLAHNGQVCYLTAALNDTFDNVPRRIYISDPVYLDPLFVYEVIENKPLWLGLVSEEGSTPYPDPQPLYIASETYGLTGVQFIVNVPTALGLTVGQVKQLTALVNQKRLPSKKNWVIAYF